MTTVYYVDLEGGAGTKDGSSFANRAGTFADLGSSSQFLGNGDHEVRIKKSPTRSLGTGTVNRRGGWFRCGYDGCGLNTSNNYWTFSTTKGETVMRYDTHGLATGDTIEIVGNRWYFSNTTMSNAHGDGSASQQSGNYVGLSGVWTVTAVDGNNLKLNEFTAPFDKPSSDSWPSGFSTSNQGRWYDVTGSTVKFNTALPVKELMPESNRKKFTSDQGGVSTYDVTCQQENWSNNTAWTVPEGANRFYVESGVNQGKVATYECPNTLDLSAYQGISFELTIGQYNFTDFRPVSSTMHGRFSIRLCTDTAGATAAHTIPIDTRFVSRTYCRGAVTFDVGGNMNAAIKSIAIYKEYNGSMSGGATFMISNLIAYKTATVDKLNHMTMIGLGTTNNPNFHCIKYIKTEGDYNLIVLGTSGSYWYEARDDYGYYGSGKSVGFREETAGNLTTTGTVYAMQGFRVSPYHSPTSGLSSDNSSNNQSNAGNYNSGKFGHGTAQNPKVISGGWDATNMSTQGTTPLDMTILTNGFGSNQGGFYQVTNGGNYLTWKNLIFTRESCYMNYSQYYRFENVQMDNCHMCYFTGNYTRGFKDLRINNRSQNFSSLMHGTHNFSDVPDGAAGMKVAVWGSAGQNEWNLGQCPGFTWSEVRHEASHKIRFNSASYFQGTTIQKLITGMYGRESTGIELQAQNTGLVFGDWESTYNHLSVSSEGDITINDMTFKRGDQTTKHGTYPTSYANYCISWNSNNIKLLGGTSEARINFSKSARINNFISTDPNEHNLQTGVTVLSANHNGVSGAGKYLNYGWNIQPETSIRHTASGTAWKLTKTSSSGNPIYDIAKVAVAGSGTVTAKIWVYRTVGGTGTYGVLRIPADVTLGVSKNEMNSTNGAANTWYELTATATPTSAGIMTIQLELVDDTNSGVLYFDDMTITQT